MRKYINVTLIYIIKIKFVNNALKTYGTYTRDQRYKECATKDKLMLQMTSNKTIMLIVASKELICVCETTLFDT